MENNEILKNKNKNTSKNIIIVLLVLILVGFIGSIAAYIVTQNIGDDVQVKITNISTFDDYDLGRKHVIYGEIISEGDYKGEKVSFSVSFDNHYNVGDIINGKYYNKNFIRSKE